MNKKRGFTLIEVIVTLAIISIVVVSVLVINNKEKSVDEEKVAYLEALKLSSSVYIEKYKNEYSEFTPGTTELLSIDELVAEGLIEGEKYNPFIEKTSEKINIADKTKEGKSYYYVKLYYEEDTDIFAIEYPSNISVKENPGESKEECTGNTCQITPCNNNCDSGTSSKTTPETTPEATPENPITSSEVSTKKELVLELIGKENDSYTLPSSKYIYELYKEDKNIISNIQDGKYNQYEDLGAKLVLRNENKVIENAKIETKIEWNKDEKTWTYEYTLSNEDDFKGYYLINTTNLKRTVKLVDNACPILIYNNKIYASEEVSLNNLKTFDNYEGLKDYFATNSYMSITDINNNSCNYKINLKSATPSPETPSPEVSQNPSSEVSSSGNYECDDSKISDMLENSIGYCSAETDDEKKELHDANVTLSKTVCTTTPEYDPDTGRWWRPRSNSDRTLVFLYGMGSTARIKEEMIENSLNWFGTNQETKEKTHTYNLCLGHLLPFEAEYDASTGLWISRYTDSEYELKDGEPIYTIPINMIINKMKENSSAYCTSQDQKQKEAWHQINVELASALRKYEYYKNVEFEETTGYWKYTSNDGTTTTTTYLYTDVACPVCESGKNAQINDNGELVCVGGTSSPETSSSETSSSESSSSETSSSETSSSESSSSETT